MPESEEMELSFAHWIPPRFASGNVSRIWISGYEMLGAQGAWLGQRYWIVDLEEARAVLFRGSARHLHVETSGVEPKDDGVLHLRVDVSERQMPLGDYLFLLEQRERTRMSRQFKKR